MPLAVGSHLAVHAACHAVHSPPPPGFPPAAYQRPLARHLCSASCPSWPPPLPPFPLPGVSHLCVLLFLGTEPGGKLVVPQDVSGLRLQLVQPGAQVHSQHVTDTHIHRGRSGRGRVRAAGILSRVPNDSARNDHSHIACLLPALVTQIHVNTPPWWLSPGCMCTCCDCWPGRVQPVKCCQTKALAPCLTVCA